MKLSDKIRIIRKARGYSQEELGYKLTRVKDGISRQAVSDWENGKSEPILDNIRDLAEVLNVSYDALLNDDINLNDKHVLNAVLKNLDSGTKEKINNSFRYRIFAYTVTKKDYIKLIVYFLLIAIGIAGTLISLAITDWGWNWVAYGFILLLSVMIGCISLPIIRINKIKRGGYRNSFGTLSQTHLVIIGWSDSKFDRTIYIPVSEIEGMKLGQYANKKHGTVIIKVKGRNKPMVTADIVEPQKLIDVFNNLETFVEIPNE